MTPQPVCGGARLDPGLYIQATVPLPSGILPELAKPRLLSVQPSIRSPPCSLSPPLHTLALLSSLSCPPLCPSSMPQPVSPQGFCMAIRSSQKARSLDLQVLSDLLRSVAAENLGRGFCPPDSRCPLSPQPRALPAHHLFYFYFISLPLLGSSALATWFVFSRVLSLSLMGMPVQRCRVRVLVLQCRSLWVSHLFSLDLGFLLHKIGILAPTTQHIGKGAV